MDSPRLVAVVLACVALYTGTHVGAAVRTHSRLLYELGDSELSHYLTDRKFVERSINCVLDQGPCDRIGNNIKHLVPFMMDYNCRRCPEFEKAFTRAMKRTMAKYFVEAYRDMVLAVRRGDMKIDQSYSLQVSAND